MRLSAKQYREQVYQLRSHPRGHIRADEFGFEDRRDSFATVYLSAIPFAVAEYFAELSNDLLPGGLVFPVGFLLFWAFYYTYYKPGFLENRLTKPTHFDLTWVPGLIVGILIWFVKVTFVEISHLVFFAWIKPETKRPTAQAGSAKRPAGAQQSRPTGAQNARSASGAQQARSAPGAQQARSAGGTQQAKPSAPPALLSPDLLQALQLLGLKPGCTWHDIHHQYRLLAKQFHPDLNPDITDFGNRFMKIDAAYNKLGKVRAQHFR